MLSGAVVSRADIAIEAGKVVAIASEILTPAKASLDATGLHVFPGLIDTHVHFNEPGRNSWEGISTGSAALAAGGGTLYFDMPLNSHPPLLNRKDFEAKKAAAEAASLTDFALWGGLTPDNLDQLEDLADCGVIGFKAFMSDSGIAEFKAVDDVSLYRGMSKAAYLGLPVAVHAESEAITRLLTAEFQSLTRLDAEAYMASRPVLAELEAISRALLYAKETGCDLHIVHVSSARAIALISEAKLRGIRVSSETCAHYLHFNSDDVLRLGAVAKCAPPLRSETERQALWQKVLCGDVDIIASDHSPSEPELKEGIDFFKVWGGIAGVQSTLNVLLSQRLKQGLALEKIAQTTAQNPASRFRLSQKGQLAVGFDADLCLLDLATEFRLEPKDLYYKHKKSPYLGEVFKGKVKQTLLRGQTIFKDAKVGSPKGQLIKPARPS